MNVPYPTLIVSKRPRFICAAGLAILVLQIADLSTSFAVQINRVSADEKQVAFAEILPILRQHCFECHAGKSIKGDLRLDTKSGVLAGGHSGNPILGNDPQNSELFLRITSTEDGYRMPKEGPPLSDDKVELIRNWILQGATWKPEIQNSSNRQENKSVVERVADGINWSNELLQIPRYRYAAILAIPFVLFMLILLIRARSKRRRNKEVSTSDQVVKKGVPFTIAVSVLLILFAVFAYQIGMVEEMRLQNDQLQSKLNRISGSVELELHRNGMAIPPYPMHPPRLGGTYYRGNDERSPSLFNGGFYRTATMDLGLLGSDAQQLQWNDRVDEDPLSISLIIRRAAGTTRSLFSERVLNTTYVVHFPGDGSFDDEEVEESAKIRLSEIDPGEAWQAIIPLDPISKWENGSTDGLAYIYYGAQMVDGKMGRAHFAINYEIQIDGGKISDQSQIWMGSLYNLSGRVLVPSEDRILLDRWFDFRPIPEIQGDNSSDPSLLGIPEHVTN